MKVDLFEVFKQNCPILVLKLTIRSEKLLGLSWVITAHKNSLQCTQKWKQTAQYNLAYQVILAHFIFNQKSLLQQDHVDLKLQITAAARTVKQQEKQGWKEQINEMNLFLDVILVKNIGGYF